MSTMTKIASAVHQGLEHFHDMRVIEADLLIDLVEDCVARTDLIDLINEHIYEFGLQHIHSVEAFANFIFKEVYD